MKTFNKIGTSEIIKKNGIEIHIQKFQKEGTGRIFFTPTINGNAIVRTMFARLYDARNLSMKYLKHVELNSI